MPRPRARRAPRSISAEPAAIRVRRSDVGNGVDERAPAPVAREPASCTSADRAFDERVVGGAVVAEQRDRHVDVADDRGPAELTLPASPAISAITAIASSACSDGAEPQPVLGPRRRACTRTRRWDPGARAARRRAGRARRSPGRSARQSFAGGGATSGRQVLLLAGPGARIGAARTDRSARRDVTGPL